MISCWICWNESGGGQVLYVFYNTGIEYEATLRHLDDLEAKYGIQIDRVRAKIPVPAGCKKYGLPFLSKDISEKIHNLQNHNFQWEDENYDDLIERYGNCKFGMRWWCGNKGPKPEYSIDTNLALKEFMLQNPPQFSISRQCCNGAKKNTSHAYLKGKDAMLNIIGERRAEGGIRATSHSTCFEPVNQLGIPKYMPLYFWSDADKEQYKTHYGIKYSDCYEVYGMKRTGCCGCPFNSRFEEDLEVVKRYEPKLYAAAMNIFGDSYEYTKAYRKFKEEFKEKRRRQKKTKSDTSSEVSNKIHQKE